MSTGIGDLSLDELEQLLDVLSPDELADLEQLLPTPAAAVEQARTALADPLRWAQTELPELAAFAPGAHHETLAALIPPDGPQGVRAAVGAPRGSGKSTILLGLIPIIVAIRRSHRFIVVIRDNLPDAIT